jgi:ATP/maltotriose-dependent transcriptional regulator MalT
MIRWEERNFDPLLISVKDTGWKLSNWHLLMKLTYSSKALPTDFVVKISRFKLKRVWNSHCGMTQYPSSQEI